jgi:WhiB family redox-sensing transcriptional regulator
MSIATLAELTADAPRWDGAKCRAHDPELWFHDAETNRDAKNWTAKAKDICGGCPLIKQCGDFALEHRIPFGVFGGMSAKERGTELRGYCRTCAEPIPAARRARYCPAHRSERRAEQNRSRG